MTSACSRWSRPPKAAIKTGPEHRRSLRHRPWIQSWDTTGAEQLGIRHVYFKPRSPHLNGKVERSHRVDDQEFYELLDQGGITDDIHLFNDKLREWEDYYNYHRPHGALGQTPYERLVEKTRAGVSARS